MPRPTGDYMAYQKYIFYILFILKFPFMSNKTLKPFVYLWECISWISVLLPLHMTICIAKTVYEQFDMEMLASVGVEAIWFFFSFLIMVYLKLRKNDLVELLTKIQETFKWRSVKGKTYVTMDKAFLIGKYFSIFWQTFPPLFIFTSIVLAYLKRPSSLPVPTWYPINHHNSYQFAAGYFLQSWSKMVMVFSFTSVSSLYLSFCLICIGQFNILRCGLKNLIYTSGLYQRFPDILHDTTEWAEYPGEYPFAHELEDTLPSEPKFSLKPSDLNNSNLSPEEIKSFQNSIKTCVQHHRDIIYICAMMERFTNWLAFFRIAELTLQICFVAFMYAKANKFFDLLILLMTLMDVFLFTCPAEYIQYQSKAVGQSLMLGPWYLVSQHFRNDFIIIMASSMRPIVFTAGKIFILNIDRFRQIVTTAFSYYTMLTNFDRIAV